MKSPAAAALLFALAGAFAFGQSSTTSRNQENGLLIARVLPDSPAAKAGVTRGDILLQLDGQQVRSISQVYRILASHRAGDTVGAVILHGSQTNTVSVQLETRLYHPALGIEFVPRDFGGRGILPPQRSGPGALVRDVEPNSPAASGGLQVGDVIVSVDGTALGGRSTLSKLIAAHKPGDQVTLSVERSDGSNPTLTVTLGNENGKAYLGVRYAELGNRMWRSIGRPFNTFRPFMVPVQPGAPGSMPSQNGPSTTAPGVGSPDGWGPGAGSYL